MFIGLTIAVVLVVTGIFYWALKPNYTLLFGSLQAESAQEVTRELEERGVPYKIKNNGRSVYVQSDKVNELRIQLAPLGAPHSDMKGYELFDANSLGMTDFMQQLNNKRALEGELSRSVNSLSQVESSRIHLVLPERSPFKQTTVEASASVILSLKRGHKLDKQSVKGITSLIAGSVEGLNAENVTIIDQAGNRLTDGMEGDSGFASGSLRMQLRKQTEQYLTNQGQSMLDRVLGPGNSVLRVSVEQNFDSIVRESDLIDPESRTIISEERSSQFQNDENRKMIPVDKFTLMGKRGETAVIGTNEHETSSRVRNYEVNKTREVFRQAKGKIKRMSASILINQKQVTKKGEDGQPVQVTEPYTAEEIKNYKEIISSALGIQPERGDQLTIEQVQFWNPENQPSPVSYWSRPMLWNDIVRWGLIVLSFLGVVALLFSIRKRLGNSQQLTLGLPGSSRDAFLDNAAGEGVNRIEGETDNTGGNKLPDNEVKQLKDKGYTMDKIKDFVEMQPSEAAQVVRVMLNADEE